MTWPGGAPLSVTPTRSRALRVEIAIGIVATGTFFVTTLFREYLLVILFGVPPQLTGQFFFEAAPSYFVGDSLLRALPAIVLSLGTLNKSFRVLLLRRLQCLPAGEIIRVAVGVAVVTWILNAAGVWPFSWRSTKDSGLPIVYMSMVGGHTRAMLLWALSLVAVTPFVEETIFRNFLLRTTVSWTRSTTSGVVVTSSLFAIGHLGKWPPWDVNQDQIAHAVWLFFASCLFASVTIRRAGCYATALTAHATYNALHFVTLFYRASHMLE